MVETIARFNSDREIARKILSELEINIQSTSTNMPKIIAISGISGSGKTTLTKGLAKKLNATAIYWDDFDSISIYPKDYIEWYNTTQNYDEWQYDALVEVLKELKLGKKIICPATKKELLPTKFIIFDAPTGRKHQATAKYIDYCIFVNTPLDIALARRILRDYQKKPNADIQEIFDELNFYLSASRPLFLMDAGSQCDLILDGSLSVETNLEIIQKKFAL